MPLEFRPPSSNVGEAARGRSTVRSGRHAEGVKLAVGGAVVYPGHGAGRVAAREKSGLRCRAGGRRARARGRPLGNAADAAGV